jgi:hypothetical protein
MMAFLQKLPCDFTEGLHDTSKVIPYEKIPYIQHYWYPEGPPCSINNTHRWYTIFYKNGPKLKGNRKLVLLFLQIGLQQTNGKRD